MICGMYHSPSLHKNFIGQWYKANGNDLPNSASFSQCSIHAYFISPSSLLFSCLAFQPSQSSTPPASQHLNRPWNSYGQKSGTFPRKFVFWMIKRKLHIMPNAISWVSATKMHMITILTAMKMHMITMLIVWRNGEGQGICVLIQSP